MMSKKKFDPHLIPLPRKIEFGEADVDIFDWRLDVQTALPETLQKSYLEALNLRMAGKGGGTVRLLLDTVLPREGYAFEVREQMIEVRASADVGFFYALQTLKQLVKNCYMPLCAVEDEPVLEMRGFQLNVKFVRQLNFENILQFIENAASYKLNTIMLEYGDRFPLKKHSVINARDALTEEQLKQIVTCAEDHYIELIPLMQCIGHLEYVLQHDSYKHLRENPDVTSQLCPANPEALALVREMLEEIIALHGSSLRRIHIGGDEARQLGVCPKCAKRVAESSVGVMFAEHLNQVCTMVTEAGLTPIIWDDILCKHPDALESLTRQATIMYWDYWSSDDQSPLLIARYRGEDCKLDHLGVIYDTYWNDSGKTATYANIGNRYSHAENMNDIGDDFLKRFGKYLGPEFPRLIKSFPYLEYYQDHGFDVLGAPSCLGQRFDLADGLENFSRTIPNMRGFAARCAESGSAGMVTTAWFNYPVEFLYYGLLATAQYTWKAKYNFST